MIHGVRYVRQDVSYISKKHSCPTCGTPLDVIKVSKVIDSNSEEAKELPPIIPGTVISTRGIKFRKYTAVGNIKWYRKEFKCPNCCRRFTVEQLKQIEAAPEELREAMIASFDESSWQTDEEYIETENTKEDSKKALKLALCIAVPVIIAVLILVAVVILSTPEFVDTNGPDNFELTEIKRDDILNQNENYSGFAETKTHAGFHSNIVGTRFRDHNYDYISRSFGNVHGVLILQATKISGDSLILNIGSTVESGNAEIVVLIDGEYYCSVDVNQNKTITLQNVSNKQVLVKLAGEGAKVKADVRRIY